MLQLNVTSLFLLTRALRPLLERGAAPGDPARVINIGSVTGACAGDVTRVWRGGVAVDDG